MMYATAFGGTLLEYVDTYINQIAILFCLILECILFAWVYKAENLVDYLNSKSRSIKVGKSWLFIVKYLLPIGIAFVWFGGMAEIVQDYSLERLAITLICAIVVFAACLFLTLKKPTNPMWGDVNGD